LILVILKSWWDFVYIQDDMDWFNIYYLIAYGHFLALLFLMVSVAVPDEFPENRADLKTYYFWFCLKNLFSQNIYTNSLIESLKRTGNSWEILLERNSKAKD